MTTLTIMHGETSLALHTLRAGADRALLLHELGGSASDWTDALACWPGGLYALDFAGHGASDWRRGGSYTPELFAADADAALSTLGPCSLIGAGIGAYVALLLAGSRPGLVPGALLLPGAGLDGGGTLPDFARRPPLVPEGDAAPGSCDPLVRLCDHDARPIDYARGFALAIRRLLLAEDATPRPPWWEAVRDVPAARPVPAHAPEAFARLAAEVASA